MSDMRVLYAFYESANKKNSKIGKYENNLAICEQYV